ncbi:MAG: hypothetical protein ACOX2O_01190 [Bdellovibrionota bacterium]|jgi:hypothetical protein
MSNRGATPQVNTTERPAAQVSNPPPADLSANSLKTQTPTAQVSNTHTGSLSASLFNPIMEEKLNDLRKELSPIPTLPPAEEISQAVLFEIYEQIGGLKNKEELEREELLRLLQGLSLEQRQQIIEAAFKALVNKAKNNLDSTNLQSVLEKALKELNGDRVAELKNANRGEDEEPLEEIVTTIVKEVLEEQLSFATKTTEVATEHSAKVITTEALSKELEKLATFAQESGKSIGTIQGVYNTGVQRLDNEIIIGNSEKYAQDSTLLEKEVAQLEKSFQETVENNEILKGRPDLVEYLKSVQRVAADEARAQEIANNAQRLAKLIGETPSSMQSAAKLREDAYNAYLKKNTAFLEKYDLATKIEAVADRTIKYQKESQIRMTAKAQEFLKTKDPAILSEIKQGEYKFFRLAFLDAQAGSSVLRLNPEQWIERNLNNTTGFFRTWTGAKDKALEQVKALSKTPNTESFPAVDVSTTFKQERESLATAQKTLITISPERRELITQLHTTVTDRENGVLRFHTFFADKTEDERIAIQKDYETIYGTTLESQLENFSGTYTEVTESDGSVSLTFNSDNYFASEILKNGALSYEQIVNLLEKKDYLYAKERGTILGEAGFSLQSTERKDYQSEITALDEKRKTYEALFKENGFDLNDPNYATSRTLFLQQLQDEAQLSAASKLSRQMSIKIGELQASTTNIKIKQKTAETLSKNREELLQSLAPLEEARRARLSQIIDSEIENLRSTGIEEDVAKATFLATQKEEILNEENIIDTLKGEAYALQTRGSDHYINCAAAADALRNATMGAMIYQDKGRSGIISFISSAGTDEKKWYAALDGKSKEEIELIKSIYFEKYGARLEDDMHNDFSGTDLALATALTTGDTQKIALAKLNSSLDYTFWASKEKVFQALTYLQDPAATPEERARIATEFKENFKTHHGKSLDAALLEANFTGAEIARCNAILSGDENTQKAAYLVERLSKENWLGCSSIDIHGTCLEMQNYLVDPVKMEINQERLQGLLDASGGKEALLKKIDTLMSGSSKSRTLGRDWLKALLNGDAVQAGAVEARFAMKGVWGTAEEQLRDTFLISQEIRYLPEGEREEAIKRHATYREKVNAAYSATYKSELVNDAHSELSSRQFDAFQDVFNTGDLSRLQKLKLGFRGWFDGTNEAMVREALSGITSEQEFLELDAAFYKETGCHIVKRIKKEMSGDDQVDALLQTKIVSRNFSVDPEENRKNIDLMMSKIETRYKNATGGCVEWLVPQFSEHITKVYNEAKTLHQKIGSGEISQEEYIQFLTMMDSLETQAVFYREVKAEVTKAAANAVGTGVATAFSVGIICGSGGSATPLVVAFWTTASGLVTRTAIIGVGRGMSITGEIDEILINSAIDGAGFSVGLGAAKKTQEVVIGQVAKYLEKKGFSGVTTVVSNTIYKVGGEAVEEGAKSVGRVIATEAIQEGAENLGKTVIKESAKEGVQNVAEIVTKNTGKEFAESLGEAAAKKTAAKVTAESAKKTAAKVAAEGAKKAGKEAGEVFISETVEQVVAHPYAVAQQYIQEKIFRRIANNTFIAATDGFVSGATFGGLGAATQEATWENGIGNGFWVVGTNSLLSAGRAAGLSMFLAPIFSLRTPRSVVDGKPISREKAINALNKGKVKNSAFGKRISLNEEGTNFLRAAIEKSDRTGQPLTRGTLRNASDISRKPSRGVIKKMSKAFKEQGVTVNPDYINKLQARLQKSGGSITSTTVTRSSTPPSSPQQGSAAARGTTATPASSKAKQTPSSRRGNSRTQTGEEFFSNLNSAKGQNSSSARSLRVNSNSLSTGESSPVPSAKPQNHSLDNFFKQAGKAPNPSTVSAPTEKTTIFLQSLNQQKLTPRQTNILLKHPEVPNKLKIELRKAQKLDELLTIGEVRYWLKESLSSFDLDGFIMGTNSASASQGGSPQTRTNSATTKTTPPQGNSNVSSKQQPPKNTASASQGGSSQTGGRATTVNSAQPKPKTPPKNTTPTTETEFKKGGNTDTKTFNSSNKGDSSPQLTPKAREILKDTRLKTRRFELSSAKTFQEVETILKDMANDGFLSKSDRTGQPLTRGTLRNASDISRKPSRGVIKKMSKAFKEQGVTVNPDYINKLQARLQKSGGSITSTTVTRSSTPPSSPQQGSAAARGTTATPASSKAKQTPSSRRGNSRTQTGEEFFSNLNSAKGQNSSSARSLRVNSNSLSTGESSPVPSAKPQNHSLDNFFKQAGKAPNPSTVSAPTEKTTIFLQSLNQQKLTPRQTNILLKHPEVPNKLKIELRKAQKLDELLTIGEVRYWLKESLSSFDLDGFIMGTNSASASQGGSPQTRTNSATTKTTPPQGNSNVSSKQQPPKNTASASQGGSSQTGGRATTVNSAQPKPKTPPKNTTPTTETEFKKGGNTDTKTFNSSNKGDSSPQLTPKAREILKDTRLKTRRFELSSAKTFQEVETILKDMANDGFLSKSDYLEITKFLKNVKPVTPQQRSTPLKAPKGNAQRPSVRSEPRSEGLPKLGDGTSSSPSSGQINKIKATTENNFSSELGFKNIKQTFSAEKNSAAFNEKFNSLTETKVSQVPKQKFDVNNWLDSFRQNKAVAEFKKRPADRINNAMDLPPPPEPTPAGVVKLVSEETSNSFGNIEHLLGKIDLTQPASFNSIREATAAAAARAGSRIATTNNVAEQTKIVENRAEETTTETKPIYEIEIPEQKPIETKPIYEEIPEQTAPITETKPLEQTKPQPAEETEHQTAKETQPAKQTATETAVKVKQQTETEAVAKTETKNVVRQPAKAKVETTVKARVHPRLRSGGAGDLVKKIIEKNKEDEELLAAQVRETETMEEPKGDLTIRRLIKVKRNNLRFRDPDEINQDDDDEILVFKMREEDVPG